MPVDDKSYIDARIEATEARLDAKVERIAGQVDVLVGELRENTRITQSENKSTRRWMVATGIAVVALLFAVFQWGFDLKTGEQDRRIQAIESQL